MHTALKVAFVLPERDGLSCLKRASHGLEFGVKFDVELWRHQSSGQAKNQRNCAGVLRGETKVQSDSGPLKPLVDLLSCLKFVFKHVRRTSEGHPVLDIDFDVGLQLEQRRPLLE